MPLRITPSVAEQEGQQTETEATGAPQKHHYTLNQQVGSITGIYYIETLDGYRFIVTAFEKGLMNGLREFIAANEEYFKYYRWS
uniref:hypothetical protein n=1 Tax=Klebsiella pneumoniae TaxID=573 RepID=UPI00312BBCD8